MLDSIVKVYCVYSRSDWLLPWQAHPKREGTGEAAAGVRRLWALSCQPASQLAQAGRVPCAGPWLQRCLTN